VIGSGSRDSIHVALPSIALGTTFRTCDALHHLRMGSTQLTRPVVLVCFSAMLVVCTIGVIVFKQFSQDAVGKSRRHFIAAATQTLAPRSSHQDFEPESWSDMTNNTERLSLVTSHFSLPPTRTHGHYPEIEDAIRINLANPALTEVVIMYETEDAVRDGCTEMKARLLAGLVNQSVPQQARLRCFERQKQPNYREMLNFASATVRPGSVVVVGNADGTMDYTATKLTGIQNGHAVVLTLTRARERKPANETFSWVQDSFRLQRCGTMSRCVNHKNLGGPPSWDAYAFRAPIPFINDTILQNIFMNSVSAESWAGHALEKVGLRVHNICQHVSWIDLHCAGRMHRPGGKSNYYVPQMCAKIDQCLGLST